MREKVSTFSRLPLALGQPVSLRSIALPMGLKVVVVGPHPDDFDEIGVTLQFSKEAGHRLRALVCRTGSGVEDSFCSPPTLDAKRRLREQEQRDSLSFFGLPETDLVFLDLGRDADWGFGIVWVLVIGSGRFGTPSETTSYRFPEM